MTAGKGKTMGEKGSALVITLLLLVLLTAIGIYAISISMSEFDMATQYKEGKAALYAAEAGVYSAIDIYPTLVDNTTFPALPNGARATATSTETGQSVVMPGYRAHYRMIFFQVTSTGQPPPPYVASRQIVAVVGFGPVPFGTMY